MTKRLKIELECPVCKEKYLKDKSEFTRNAKKNRMNFCSLACSAKYSFRVKIPIEKNSNYDISQHSKNLIDEFTDFRYAFKTIKSRMHKGCDISLNDLKEIWELQNGICPYSGIKLKLMKHGYKFSDIAQSRFEIASLDRIDSSKGYEKGNLVFVSTTVNFMKNSCSVEEIVKFIFIMKEYLQNKTSEDIISEIEKYTTN
jgi:hypothetical protein